MSHNTVAEFVKDSISRFPTLYQSRTDVLHHAFLLLGNGCEWRDGVLVKDEPCADEFRRKPAPIRTELAAELAAIGLDLADQALDRAVGAEDREISAEEVKRRAALTTAIANPYPWQVGCNLSRIPADVKPDWAAAAAEIHAACAPHWTLDAFMVRNGIRRL